MTRTDRIVAVVGPTASGKSDLAVAMAVTMSNAEIVNVDSMQVYRGMDVGTAKLPPAERRGIVHHLLDVLDVSEPSTVAEFQRWARAAIADCHGRGVIPILVGGSALYIRAVLDRFEFPGTDPDIRARWELRLAECGAAALHEELAARDPDAAAAILSTNSRRIVRALEVGELTGKPFVASLPTPEFAYDDVVLIGLDVPRETLAERIEDRVNLMWAGGLVEEVRHLESQGLAEGRTASRALGYSQILGLLAGRCSEDEARLATITGTRRFARRQDAWFRRDPRIQWLDADASDLAARAVELATGVGRLRR